MQSDLTIPGKPTGSDFVVTLEAFSGGKHRSILMLACPTPLRASALAQRRVGDGWRVRQVQDWPVPVATAAKPSLRTRTRALRLRAGQALDDAGGQAAMFLVLLAFCSLGMLFLFLLAIGSVVGDRGKGVAVRNHG